MGGGTNVQKVQHREFESVLWKMIIEWMHCLLITCVYYAIRSFK